MPTVKFTANLKRFYPELRPLEVQSKTISGIIEEINATHNGIKDEVRVAVDTSLCVYRTTDGGKTWHDYRAGLPQGDAFDIAYRHALDVAGDTLAFGTTTGNLYLSNDGGESWISLNNNLPMIYSLEFCDLS